MSKPNRRDRARGARAESSQSGFRRIRHERQLFEELHRLLREAADPALQDVVPLGLELSADGGHARIPFAVRASGADEDSVRRTTSEALRRASGHLRSGLAAALALRKVPALGFAFVGLADPGDPREGVEP